MWLLVCLRTGQSDKVVPNLALCAVLIVSLVSGCPSCLLRDTSDSDDVFNYLPQFFWQGIESQYLGAGTTVNIPIQTPGSVSSFDVASNCGIVFIGCGPGSNPQFSAADYANLASYYAASGTIIVIGELPGFCSTNFLSFINTLIPTIDSSVSVRYQSMLVNVLNCGQPALTAAGMSNAVFLNPNDLTTAVYFAASGTFTYPMSTDPECLVTSDTSTFCSAAQDAGFLFFTDVDPFCDFDANAGCVTASIVGQLGENIGNYVQHFVCGGAGGDPHIFSFDGSEVHALFDDGKNYLMYSTPDFKVVIHTSGPSTMSYITSIGVTIGNHRLLATNDTNGDPGFFFDGEPLIDSVSTPAGEASVFVPDDIKFIGALAQLERYIQIGLKVGNALQIVGGYHPQTGLFFNVELHKLQRDDAGFLRAATESKTRMGAPFKFLQEFEIPSLFE